MLEQVTIFILVVTIRPIRNQLTNVDFDVMVHLIANNAKI